MDDLRLPNDLVAFLRDERQLQYDARRCECGQIKLLSLSQLKLGEVWVNSDESPLADSDPHAGEEGYYSIRSVNLVADADGYDPEGILVWLPDSQQFGSWDPDHWDLFVFPGKTWTQIAENPLPYINAQWDHKVEREYFVPWPQIPFKAGQPF